MNNTNSYRLILLGLGVVASARTAHAGDDSEGDKPEASLNSIASGRLSRNGITAGVAIAMFTPLAGDGVQRSVATGPMPYIEIRPNRLVIRGDITRAYCAARYTAGNAQEIADRVAFDKAGLSIHHLGDIDKLSTDDKTLMLRDARTGGEALARLRMFAVETLDHQRRGTEEQRALQADIAGLPDPLTLDGFDRLSLEGQKLIVSKFVQDHSGWELGKPGDCSPWADFGLYVGRPGTYKANVPFTTFTDETSMGETTRTPRHRHARLDVEPVLSFGVTYSPISEVRLMAGLTLSNAVRETDGPASHVWAFTLALGGNLDIAGALIK